MRFIRKHVVPVLAQIRAVNVPPVFSINVCAKGLYFTNG